MTRYWLCCLLVLSACTADAAVRRHKHYTGVYLGVGVAFPTGDFDDAWSLGAHGMAAIGFPVSPTVEFLPSVQVYSFSYDDYRFRFDDGTFTDIQLGLDFKINFPSHRRASTVVPFFTAGMGLAIKDVTITTAGPRANFEETSTDGFLAFGAGIELGKAFLMLRYNHVFDDAPSEFVPFTVGLRL